MSLVDVIYRELMESEMPAVNRLYWAIRIAHVVRSECDKDSGE